MDRVLALCLLILFLPVIIVAALLVMIFSPGNPFYAQQRVGKNNKLFWIFKIRTMKRNADSKTKWTTKKDPRIIPFIGSILRNSNIDELPQFLNVVIGDMALVGPRPEQKEFVDKFATKIANYNLRHTVKPGITGWAVVNNLTGDTDITERTQYDLWYISNRNLFLDISIMIRTAFFKRKFA